MTDEPALPADDRDALAAELALGLLTGDERATALRQVLEDPAFARAVEQWRAHFATLVDDVAPVEPPAGAFARLEAAIGSAPAAQVANDNARVRRWQMLTGLTGIAAVALAAITLTRPAPPTTPPVVVTRAAPVLVATIASTEDAQPIGAAYYPDRHELRLAPSALADSAHSAELWIIAADGVPHSLGVLPPGQARHVTITPAQIALFVRGSKLVVTREQPGGSPDGKPKGPAIAAGPLLSV